MEEPLQKSLERYDVLDRIAVGGMAEVFLAKAYGAHGFEKTLAIKRILPELASDPEFAARFIAEAKVAVKLSHANVVQVFDFGRIGESLFIAMEYVDGLDLAALIKKYKDDGRHIPMPAALHIAIEIIRGLDFAHQHNVVHRDVSPSNILISRAGEVKLGDFGIAVASAPHRAGGPGPRKVMGKWRYMSPEQTRGDTLDTRSDLFSAASVMFELFTCQKLFPGDEVEDIVKNIDSMPIPKTSSLRPGLPSRLDDILAGPLARKPIDRPSRPATVLRQLIELSYESSIMATALDVAEAVASVLPPAKVSGPGQQLDEVIRKQLGAAERERSIARRTAVTDGKPPSTETMDRLDYSTGMIRKIGQDGLSHLEEIDPTAVAAPRAKRLSESGAVKAISPDSAMHRLLDAHVDPDRRTEVGGPPTGAMPKSDATANAPKRTTRSHARARSRTGLWIAIAAVLVVVGGFGAWQLTKDKDRSEVAGPTAPRDAGIEVVTGTLEIDPSPEGATGYIADTAGVIAKQFGPTSHKTPVRLAVEAGKPFRVHLELEGYEPIDQQRSIKANETLVISPELRKARAKLEVNTTPAGAQVALRGRLLGETPLVRTDLDPVKGELVITKAGYEPYKEKVQLEAGKLVRISQPLKAAPKYGTIAILFNGLGWADVYLKGTLIGRAPSRELRAPVGRQTFQLVNTGRKPYPKWTLVCEVKDNEVNECRTQLP